MDDPQEKHKPVTTSGTVVIEVIFTIDRKEETACEIEDVLITCLENVLKEEDVAVELINSDLYEDTDEPPCYNKEDDEDFM